MNTVLMYDGGLQTVNPLQVVYLDFDGANTAYHGEALTIDAVTVQKSGLADSEISSLTERLNAAYEGNILFVTERPQSGDYSTVYVGATDAFSYRGLAETVDVGNQNHTDNAFVNLQGGESLETIQQIIAHEVGHLTGALDHGGDGLAAYAYGSRYDVSSGVTSTNVNLNDDSMYVSSGGVANNTHAISSFIYISSGGVANSTTMSWSWMDISSGGLASNNTISWGRMFVGGAANSTSVNYSGSMYINSGGTANNTTVNSSGSLYIYSSGVTNNTTVNSSGSLYIYSSGVTNNTTVNNNGDVYIFSGGLASNTTMTGGRMFVSSGGLASNTTISWGQMFVSSGGLANSTTVISNGLMGISAGGVANSTVIDSYGSMFISSGGKASNTTVKFLGSMDIYSGGVATATVNNGSIRIYSGGVTSNTTVNSNGLMTISSGGSALDVIWTPCVGKITVDNGAYVTYASSYSGCYLGGNNELRSQGITMSGEVDSNDEMYVFSGGVASNITMTGGRIFVSSGGVANGTTMNNNGNVYIFLGGVASNTTISWGQMFVSSGGVASNTTVNSNGSMTISSGGSALNVIWTPCVGKITVDNGAYVSYASSYSGCYFGDNNELLSQGMTMSGKVVYDQMYIFSGGVANNTTVNLNGLINISSGGVVNSTTINSGGSLFINSSGVANSTTVNLGGVMYISSGGSALNVIWTPCVGYVHADVGAYVTYQSNYSGCYLGYVEELQSQGMTMTSKVVYDQMYIFSNGVANSTVVDSYGSMFISSGGKASNTTVKFLGSMDIYSGGVATATVNNGSIRIYSGGLANRTTVNPNGFMTISSGGVANSTTVISNGLMGISAGGVANSTIVNSYGNMYISSGGMASTTTVNSNGLMGISAGGVTKNTTVNSYGSMTISSGGKITGNLTIATGAVVSAYSGSEINFDLTERASGDSYLINNLSLINGAPDYTITVSATQATGIYKLAQGADSFTQTISIGDSTNIFGGLSANGATVKYGNYEYSLLQNNGNLSLSIVITDKIAPTITNISASPTGFTNQNVLVSAVFADNVELALSQYKIGDGDWINYTGAISVASNATVYFKAVDTSDNEATTQYDVKNILAVDPKGPGNVTPSAKINKYDATLSWQAPITQDKAKIVSYEVYINGQLTSAKGTSLSLKAMQISVGNTVQVRALDSLGRYGALSQTITFDIKDVTAPVLGKITTALNQYTATVNYSGSDNVGVDHYQVKCGSQTQTLAGTSATFNTLALGINNVEVIAFDAAGNASKAVKTKITVKDVTAPGQVSGLAAPSVDSKYKATLSWSAGVDNSGSVAAYEIQLDNGKILKSSKTTLAVNSLAVGQHSYQVRAIDKAKNVGEWSAAKAFTVLDTTAPGTVSIKAVVAQNSILLSWKAPADNVGVTGYQVWVGASPSTMTMEQALSAKQLSCVLTNVAKGVYYMDVRAVDAADNVSATKPAKVTVSTALPVSSLAMSSSHVDLLTWSAPNQTSLALASGL